MTDDLPIAAAMPSDDTEPEPQPPRAQRRAQLVARFEQWLDQMLPDEPPPSGVPEHILSQAIAAIGGDGPSQAPDLYTLFSGLTTLTGEIRLQGRTFKQLTDLLSPLAETPAMLARLHESQVESANSIQAALDDQFDDPNALPIPFKQVCDVMIDLYDRLQRGLQTCEEGIRSLEARRQHPGLLHRLLAGPGRSDDAVLSVRAIRDAAALTLARLQAALQEWGIERIGRVGEPFDPERMTAVDVRLNPEAEPGSVLIVNRSGYALNGTLKAGAQVTVNKSEI